MKHEDRQWAIVALNQKSIQEARKLADEIPTTHIYTIGKYMDTDLRELEGGLKKHNKTLFENYKVIIYIMAMGIIVRDIAPYLKHKSVDPAVLCLSVDGQYIIPVLSGHLGGANDVAIEISEAVGAIPIITTASDVLGKTAVDMIAKSNDLVITSFKMAKDLTAMMINNEQVVIVAPEVVAEDGSKISPVNGEIQGMSVMHDVDVIEFPDNLKGIIHIGYDKKVDYPVPSIRLLPKRLILGIGARRDTPYEAIRSLLDRILTEYNIDIKGIKAIASIDLKADEKGIIELSEVLKVPFITYNSELLGEVEHRFEKSEFVKRITGVGAVSMPSGYLASSKGRCLVKKVVESGITMSIWEEME